MSTKPVYIEKKDHIATLVLNRPGVMNAMSKEMILGLQDAVREIASDDSIRVLLLKGAGRPKWDQTVELFPAQSIVQSLPAMVDCAVTQKSEISIVLRSRWTTSGSCVTTTSVAPLSTE